MKKLMLLGLCMLLVFQAERGAAQTGTLQGRISDEGSGEPLIGATIFLMGTRIGTTTDLDGNYRVGGIPPGSYEVRITFLNYERKTVTGVTVKAGETLKLDVGIKPLSTDANPDAAFTIEDVRVSAQRVLSTDAAVLVDRLKAATIGDAISAEQISKSPDATSGDALKRVTGLSVVDDKFVFIRGVTDRYNITMLNGVSVSSTDTDVDKKSFSYDLIPAELLSNTVVTKSATPNLPGDFSGGAVQMNTLDFPSRRIFKLTVGGSYNTAVSNEDILTSAGGSRDWLGRDDGTRALPGGGLEGIALARALPNNWGPVGDRADMNARYSLALGDAFRLGGQEFGYVGSVVYRNGFDKEDFIEAPKLDDGTTPYFHYEGTRYKYKVLAGGLLDLNYRLHPDHALNFRNSYSRSAQEAVSRSDGEHNSDGPTRRQTIEWDERYNYSGRVGGRHVFPFLFNFETDWEFHVGDNEAAEPDRKHVEYRESPAVPGTWVMRENYRTWSELREDTRGWAVNATLPARRRGGTFLTRFRFGYLASERDRAYGVETWVADISTVRSPNYGIPLLPIEEIFDPDNFGDRKMNFKRQNNLTGEYEASHELSAYYGMLDHFFTVLGQRFRLVGGARVEDSDQLVISRPQEAGAGTTRARIDEKDVLPSANFTYLFNDWTNVRFAYSKAVNRPEFREMSNVFYFDFNRSQYVRGNPNLKRATIDNYDVRFELFPDVGQVISFSYFYKDFRDPIEEKYLPSNDRYVLTWFNSPRGKNYGWEVEARLNFGLFAGFLRNFTVMGNYTEITSEIEFEDKRTDTGGNVITETLTRPMQGQSPWMVNVGLYFDAPRTGTDISVLYNRIGRRIYAVGDVPKLDVYEEPRDLLDVAVTQRLFWNTQIKFAARDLIADDVLYTSGIKQAPHTVISTGSIYSLAFTYKF